jgi:hypothetical protein
VQLEDLDRFAKEVIPASAHPDRRRGAVDPRLSRRRAVRRHVNVAGGSYHWAGSGLSLARIALSVRMRGENG